MDVIEGCDIKVASITTEPKGFINYTSFLSFIEFFENSVTDSDARPLVLFYDDCANHYNDEIVKKSIELKVILVILRANATHLIFPFDRDVFKPFKVVIRKCALDFMLERAITTISQKDAMTIGSKARREAIESKTTNIASGFIAACLWPLYFPAM